MATSEIRLDVAVSEPAEVTWSAVADFPRQGEWMLGTSVYVLSGDGDAVGSTLAAFTGLAGVGVLDTMEITEWEPPCRCTVRHTGSLVRGTGGFRVIDSGGRGSTLVWWERFDLPPGTGPLWPLVRPAFEWGLRRSLDSFAEFAHRYRPDPTDGADDE